jgi:hypothetical protein
MNRSALLSCLFVVGAASIGCLSPTSTESVGASQEAIAGDGASTYYIVTHQDMRRCAYPTCGGVFVKKLNAASTRCADGVLRSECHVADVDLSAIGLADADSSKFQDTFAQGYGIVRGALSYEHAAATLTASEAWVTATLSEPSGTFYGLSSTGIECFAYPCSNLLQEKLDSSAVTLIAGVDFTPSGANSKQIAQANAMLSTTGILAAGTHHTVHGPGGDGHVLDATQFYTRLEPAPATGVACGVNTCGEGEYCCNPSCGTCIRTGAMCTYQTCN